MLTVFIDLKWRNIVLYYIESDLNNVIIYNLNCDCRSAGRACNDLINAINELKV